MQRSTALETLNMCCLIQVLGLLCTGAKAGIMEKKQAQGVKCSEAYS